MVDGQELYVGLFTTRACTDVSVRRKCFGFESNELSAIAFVVLFHPLGVVTTDLVVTVAVVLEMFFTQSVSFFGEGSAVTKTFRSVLLAAFRPLGAEALLTSRA